MIKKIKHFFFIACSTFLVFFLPGAFAQSWGTYGNNPEEVLNSVVSNADTGIIETELDKVYNTGRFGSRNKIANTLESVRLNITVYLERLAFFVLTAGVGLIIYNGILLVISPLSPDQAGKVKTRMLYIFAGLLVGTGFYYIIKIVLSVSMELTSQGLNDAAVPIEDG